VTGNQNAPVPQGRERITPAVPPRLTGPGQSSYSTDGGMRRDQLPS